MVSAVWFAFTVHAQTLWAQTASSAVTTTSGSTHATPEAPGHPVDLPPATPETPSEAVPGTPGAMAPAPAPEANAPASAFSFGSYGRVGVASDLRGGAAQPTNVVGWGPRFDLPGYAEIQFNYDQRLRDILVRTVVTLAFDQNLFHYTGNFQGNVAVRNLYVEERGALLSDLTLWVGSRMYRGDDIYLLNFWPLDNLNTVGGGASYDAGTHFTAALHLGMNVLDDPYQYQPITVAPRYGFGPVTALLLDRPRVITSAKATYFTAGRTAREGIKLSLYGEYHAMASGVEQTDPAGNRQLLPSDSGYVLGAQVGLYRGPTFVNLFARYAQGLGAYGELSVPVLADGITSSQRAEEFRMAFSANYDGGFWDVMAGGYVRYFRDADPGVYSRNALWEGCIDVRPMVYFGDHFGISVDASYQSVMYDALDPVTSQGAGGNVWRFAVIPFVSPLGRGAYTRPHITVTYAVTLRDAGALRLYAPGDPLGLNGIEHYLGVGTEWWFNSSYL